MHVGMAAVFQNPEDQREDHGVYAADLALARQAEPLGFESVWGVEHHFTDYTMCPNVTQFLSYMAGCTERIQLGSMVIVLPWHDPMRVAEEISMLDALSGGRMILGLGRGVGRVEFEGFRVPMQEARTRFLEGTEMILEGLERGWCEYDGTLVQQPRRDIRPRPFKSFKGRTYAAGISPDSIEAIARLGLGMLIIPQKPWDQVAADLESYRSVFAKVAGGNPPPPVCAGWVFCDPDEERAREQARRYIGGYWRTVVKHYEFASDHFAKTKGYEYYTKMSDSINERGVDSMVDFFLGLQIWGTPEQCFEKIVDNRTRIGNETFVGVFSYAAMPDDESERNMRLFASEVMPELQKLSPLA